MIDWLKDNWQWIVTWALLLQVRAWLGSTLDELKAARRADATPPGKREELAPRNSEA